MPVGRPLRVVAVLCWLWGGGLGLVGIAFILWGVQAGGPAVLPGLGLLALAPLYAWAGFAIRRGRRYGGWIAVVTAILLSVFLAQGGGVSFLVIGGTCVLIAVLIRKGLIRERTVAFASAPLAVVLVLLRGAVAVVFVGNVAIVLLLLFNWGQLRVPRPLQAGQDGRMDGA